MLPEATNPELYAEPRVFDMTVRDVTAGRETIKPEAAVPEAPPAPPPPEAMKPELYAVPFVTVMTVTVLSVPKPSITMEIFPSAAARLRRTTTTTTPHLPHEEPDTTAGASEHEPSATDQPTPSTTPPHDPDALDPTTTLPASPEPYNLNDELDLAMALVFKDFLENRGGCTPGVPWQIVDGGFRCGACVGPMVHFLSDEEVDRMESEPGHQPRVVIAREDE
ncbi:hypothetical protein LTR17_012488 [Elasticomyces elasticus]|nr:hypothetical protein LTR17_012488 [Elasticomyces elasticus]